MPELEPETTGDCPSLILWAVYDHPRDDPEVFIARKWAIAAGGAFPTMIIMRHPDLEQLRASLAGLGLHRIDRRPGDDPVIVEVWV